MSCNTKLIMTLLHCFILVIVQSSNPIVQIDGEKKIPLVQEFFPEQGVDCHNVLQPRS